MDTTEAVFEIGRQGTHEFEVYETVTGETAAIKEFRAQIDAVASPEEIRIYEKGVEQPRRDLEEKGEEGWVHPDDEPEA
jgi:hypothetical protein